MNCGATGKRSKLLLCAANINNAVVCYNQSSCILMFLPLQSCGPLPSSGGLLDCTLAILRMEVKTSKLESCVGLYHGPFFFSF